MITQKIIYHLVKSWRFFVEFLIGLQMEWSTYII